MLFSVFQLKINTSYSLNGKLLGKLISNVQTGGWRDLYYILTFENDGAKYTIEPTSEDKFEEV